MVLCQCQCSPKQEHCREGSQGTHRLRALLRLALHPRAQFGAEAAEACLSSAWRLRRALIQMWCCPSLIWNACMTAFPTHPFFFLFIKSKTVPASEKPVCKIKVCIKAMYEKLSSWQAVAIWRCIYLSGNGFGASNRETIPYKQQH